MGENEKILSTLCQWELISAEQAVAGERGAGSGGAQRKTNSASNIASNAALSTHEIWKECVGVLHHPFSRVCLLLGVYSCGGQGSTLTPRLSSLFPHLLIC